MSHIVTGEGVEGTREVGSGISGGGSRNDTVSRRYRKQSHLEHIQQRPDTYIGSCEARTEALWTFCSEKRRMEHRSVTFVPGLQKIVDEILVNAADNKRRDASMRYIKVTIAEDHVVVENDGAGIPVEMHAQHGVYVPQMVFGELLSGDNYDDEEERIVGGRNGYGAKLTNIFSTKFELVTVDTRSGKKYAQTWTDHMSNMSTPRITGAGKHKDFTRVSFWPDFTKFGLAGFTPDVRSLLEKRVYDLAGTTAADVRVYLNGDRLPVQNFKQYCGLYTSSKLVHEVVNERWEIAVTHSPDQQPQQVSFCNGVCTTKGGEHVKYVGDAVAKQLVRHRLLKDLPVKPFMVVRSMFVFVNALIVNPSFESQTKETLTTRSKDFGPAQYRPMLSDAFLRRLAKQSGVVEEVAFFARAKSQRQLQRKTGGRKKTRLTVPKLDDANWAGGRRSAECTLILTEGDSAKTLAISGLSVIGRDRYGVFPLKGKLLNVRDASNTAVINNAEVQNIIKILGLQVGRTYDAVKDLRYGHVMIMTDQDHDGSHIKGLIVNFLHHFWPSLLALPGFLQFFITPIVKCTPLGGGSPRVFYTTPEFDQWRSDHAGGWRIKYYKGLGTSNAKEAKEYFSNLSRHRIRFEALAAPPSLVSVDPNDPNDLIDMCFSKKRVADRKNWIAAHDPRTHVDFDVEEMTYANFVNKEYVVMAVQSNLRGIPHVIDGLKPSQRKILFACLKRNLRSEVKVAQLAGYVSEHAAYHHGEMSLNGAIVNMAQDYVGSNNINLLCPNGQFGTRLAGGKDSASPRYVFTQLSGLTSKLFHPADAALYQHLEDDGQSIEPAFYVPVLPMLLVNGAIGIGTGFSTSVPSYNPLDLVDRLRGMLAGSKVEGLIPWFRGFTGTVEPVEPGAGGKSTGKFLVRGVWMWVSETTLRIVELPVGTWTNKYKTFLENAVTDGNKFFKRGEMVSFESNYTDTAVDFQVHLSPEFAGQLRSGSDANLERMFRLTSTLDIGNMHAFGANGGLRKYTSELDILSEFFDVRLELYARRKDHMLSSLDDRCSSLREQVRFIELVVSGDFSFVGKGRSELVAEFERHSFASGAQERLLRMPMWNLTEDRKRALQKQYDDFLQEHQVLQVTSPEQFWTRDLDDIQRDLGGRNSSKKRQHVDEEKTEGGRKGERGGDGRKIKKNKR